LRQNGIRDVDVAVLGGGPAGAAMALGLVKRGCSTVVVERSDYRNVRIGETLTPAVRPLLVSLGIWDRFLAEGHSPSFNIRSAWGGDHLHDNNSIFNPHGAGWRVDRARFDAMLARCAERLGALVYRKARLLSCEKDKSGNWKIEIAHGDRRRCVSTRFIVDATGRASYAARKQGARRLTWDHLIGVVSFFCLTSDESGLDSSTLIEAAEDGWWYSAALPDSRLVVTYMTDADLYARGRKGSTEYWLQQLQRTTHTRSRVESYVHSSGPFIFPANSSRLDLVADRNWLAIGDAAMAFDPLSGQGVFRALQSALRAAELIEIDSVGDNVALRNYAGAVEKNFERYCSMRRKLYAGEQRWPQSLFWQRRASNPSVVRGYSEIR
jgi:2-polyprenyl-6-methoxyphenol hydroxylase-like FAD-dependent oxidoreductase